jgi:hypothetical protein
MTTSSSPEDNIAECKRRVNECYAISETTVVPEYREALLAMARAWMKIAHGEQERQLMQQATYNRLQVPSVTTPESSGRI